MGLDYALTSLAWSVGGFMVGFTLAAFVFARRYHYATAEQRTVDVSTTEWLKRVGIVLLIGLALLSTIAGLLSTRAQQRAVEEQARVARCQALFNSNVIDVIAERSRSTTQDRENMIELVRRVLQEEESDDALRNYIRQAEKLMKDRPDLPFPPKCVRDERN